MEHFLFAYIYIYLWEKDRPSTWVPMGGNVSAHVWRSEDRGHFYSTIWFSGIKCRLSGLVASNFTHWTNLPVHKQFLTAKETEKHIKNVSVQLNRTKCILSHWGKQVHPAGKKAPNSGNRVMGPTWRTSFNMLQMGPRSSPYICFGWCSVSVRLHGPRLAYSVGLLCCPWSLSLPQSFPTPLFHKTVQALPNVWL